MKVPKLNFPIQAEDKAPLVQDLRYYDKNALYNDILQWRENNIVSDGVFKTKGMIQPKMDSTFASLDIYGMKVKDKNKFIKPYTNEGVFGYDLGNTAFEKGEFPQYFKQDGDHMTPVLASEVPDELGLKEAEFTLQENAGTYSSPEEGSWKNTGPASGPYEATLNDGSQVTYYWYKFIDQPVFGQFNWSEDKKLALTIIDRKNSRRMAY